MITPGITARTRRHVRLILAALVGLLLALVAGSGVPALAAANSDTLYGAPNESLQNQSIISMSGAYRATMQSDGNFVVYGPSGPIWSSNTHGDANSRLVMQSDGNVVIYDGSAVLFATGTSGRGGNRLVMQNDGNLVLYGSSAIWASMNSSERAIQWFYNHMGNTSYEGKCELAVENAFGTSGRYATAIANWNARAQQQPYTSAPRGALVFYNTSTSGHVTISLGQGSVVSSSAPGGKIGISSISYFQRPLGWAWSPW